MEDKDESLISHIEAFRLMVFKCIRVFGIVLIPSFFAAPSCLDLFIKIILKDKNIVLNYFSPAEVFIIQIKAAFLIALVVSFPYIIKQVWNFCLPALYEHERKFIKTVVFASSLLFVAGSVFCLFLILPLVINFGLSFSNSNINPVFGISNVMELSIWLILAFGVMFQLPLVTYSIIKSGIASYNTIKNLRPYVIVGILVVSGILTPPDIVSQIALFIPTYLLFELGLILSCKYKDKE